MSKLANSCEKYKGQQIAVLCARYQYRGVLAEVNEDHLILANATAVEVSGPARRDTPETEDAILSSIIISYGAIEIVYQPLWALAPLPNGN